VAKKVEVHASCDDWDESFDLGRINLDTFEAEMNIPHSKRILYRFYVDGEGVVDPVLSEWTDENDEVYNLLELWPTSDPSADINQITLSWTTTTPYTGSPALRPLRHKRPADQQTQFPVILRVKPILGHCSLPQTSRLFQLLKVCWVFEYRVQPYVNSKNYVVDQSSLCNAEVDEYGFIRSKEHGSTIVVFALRADPATIDSYAASVGQVLG